MKMNKSTCLSKLETLLPAHTLTKTGKAISSAITALMLDKDGAHEQAMTLLTKLGAVDRRTPAHAPDEIHCNLSWAFHNKQMLPGHDKRAFSNSFIPCWMNIRGLMEHVWRGRAFTPGLFQTNKRRKDTFVSSQILALDFDDGISIEDALTVPVIFDYGTILYATPSHTEEFPKTRVIFVLENVIDTLEAWEATQTGLINHVASLNPDPACKDAARLFYGSTQRGLVFAPQRIMPMDVAHEFAAYEIEKQRLAREFREQKPVRVIASNQAENYTLKAMDSELDILRLTPDGSRHKQLFKSACSIFGMVRGGWPGINEGLARRELERVAVGFCSNDSERRDAFRTIDDAWRSAEPRLLNVS